MELKESRRLAAIAVKALEDKLATDISVIEIDKISPLGDYFVIATGRNYNQTEAMVDAVEEAGTKAGFEPDHIEGHKNGNWTLLDYKGVVIHIFDEDARSFYDLDRIWKDGTPVDADEVLAMNIKKIRVIVPLLLSTALCLSTAGCSADGAFAFLSKESKEEGDPLLPDNSQSSSREGEKTDSEEIVIIEEQQDPVEGTAEKGTEGLSGFHYDQIPEEERKVYEQLYTGISEHKSEFYITADSAENVGPALRALLADHPEFFWLTGSASIYGFPGPGIKRITLEFNIDPADIDSQQALIEAEAAGYLGQLYDGMSEYEKVRLAYEYVIRNTDYVMGAQQSQNIQSSMIYHESVCAGYAREFQYLLANAGVFCAYIEGDITDRTSGSMEAHAWNLVMIDGEYTYADPTWGDPNYTSEEQNDMAPEVTYSYLCLTSDDLARSGYQPTEEYTIPETYSRTWDYYVLNGYYHEYYNYDEIYTMLIDAINNGADSVHMKFSDFDNYSAAKGDLYDGELLSTALQHKMSIEGKGTMSYYPVNEDALYTIDIYW